MVELAPRSAVRGASLFTTEVSARIPEFGDGGAGDRHNPLLFDLQSFSEPPQFTGSRRSRSHSKPTDLGPVQVMNRQR